jgi:Ca2+-binding EF-hand superfamily protein
VRSRQISEYRPFDGRRCLTDSCSPVDLDIELDCDEALCLLRTALDEQTDEPVAETRLTVDQFATLMLRHVGSSELNDELRRTFDAFDLDRDGRITRNDFDRVRADETLFDRLDDEQYELMARELTASDDMSAHTHQQGIDFEQFVRLMMD